MRGSMLLLMLFLGAMVFVRPVRGQETRVPPAPVGIAVPAFQVDIARQTGPHWHHRVLTAVGGAALGAGIGFFASQLARGDWDDGPGQPQINRSGWAAVGGSLGMALGASFPLTGRGPPGLAGGVPSHLIITAEEIQSIVAMDAYEAVEVLRPQWLVARPARTLGDLPVTEQPVGGSLTEGIPVYLDDFRLGGVNELRGLSTQRIESIRLISAAAATARWGPGNSRGVIQVVTRGGME